MEIHHRQRFSAILIKHLKTILDPYGTTLAHALASQGQCFNDSNVLKIEDHSKWTVAHEMARQGHVFSDRNILGLVDKHGLSVAHVSAERGTKFKDRFILALEDDMGLSVADIMQRVRVTRGFKGLSTRALANYIKREGKYLSYVPKERYKEELRQWGQMTTIAHLLSEKGLEITESMLLVKRNGAKETVAHIQAAHGYLPEDSYIQKLKDANGTTVLEVYRKYKKKTKKG